jgi:hypothetical protein
VQAALGPERADLAVMLAHEVDHQLGKPPCSMNVITAAAM